MHRDTLSFCTTALARPEILDRTYASFAKNCGLHLENYILNINIDPIPNEPQKVQETLAVARKYFKVVIHRTPATPNFSKALNFCWTQARTDYIFNLEDDWILTKKIHLEYMVGKMKEWCALELILRAYPYEYTKLALSPGVWSRKLYGQIAGQFEEDRNPEVQLRDPRFAKLFSKSNIKVYSDTPIVQDIGREWLKEKGLEKPVKAKFVSY